eukprot:GHVR01129318.1.p1 GENE.GHVR01129318.1~~GHVR01129318.1.p1  ORF type:complete len:159 (+),score=38.01 GHVR01129318.1:55-477(+)
MTSSEKRDGDMWMTSRNKNVRIGPQYQAVIPDCMTAKVQNAIIREARTMKEFRGHDFIEVEEHPIKAPQAATTPVDITAAGTVPNRCINQTITNTITKSSITTSSDEDQPLIPTSSVEEPAPKKLKVDETCILPSSKPNT